MLALALPVLAEEALNLLVGYTDWFLAGRFLPGEEPKAAMALMSYVLWMLPSLFSAVGIGALAVIARLVGAGEGREASHVARQSLLLGCFAAIGGMVLAVCCAARFVSLMQLQGQSAALATRYIQILAPAIPLMMVEYVGTSCLRGAGDTVTGLLARVVVNIVNLLLSTALVTGLGPFPKLGWSGLAIGTATGHAVGGLIILWRLWSGRARIAILETGSHEARRASLDWAVVRRVLRIGIPGAFDLWAVLICHLTYVAIINSLGTLAQAAHGLGLQIEAMSYLPGSAFQVAAATLAGQSLGANDRRRAVQGVLMCVLSAAAIMSVAGLIMFTRGESIAMFFTGERTATTVLTGKLLKIVAISCPSLAVLMVISGALRGSGDTAWPLAITFVGLVGVRIPGACLLAWSSVEIPFTSLVLPGFGLGVAGAWMAMASDVILRSMLIAGRFAQGAWQKVRV